MAYGYRNRNVAVLANGKRVLRRSHVLRNGRPSILDRNLSSAEQRRLNRYIEEQIRYKIALLHAEQKIIAWNDSHPNPPAMAELSKAIAKTRKWAANNHTSPTQAVLAMLEVRGLV